MTAAPGSTPIELVTVGTEILLGHTIDTNSAHLGRELAAIGLRVVRRTTVPDTGDAIRAAVDEALTRTRLVLTTGGLGPTRDDITKQVVAELLGMPLVFHDRAWQLLLERYVKLQRAPAESNRSQAMVPEGGVMLPNPWGTAPGLWLETSRGVVIMLPGVPHEMTRLLEAEVLPRLVALGGTVAVRSRTLRTAGVPESTLAEAVDPLETALAPLSVAYLPGVAGVDLRLTSWDATPAEADRLLAAGIEALRSVAAPWAWGEDDADLAAVVIAAARDSGDTIAVAESCTGGLLGGRLTDAPGSSDVFLGGVVAYSYMAKETLLGVDAGTIAARGAVSGEVAEAMASAALDRFGASLAVAITGIAGPGGGTADKPTGLVWFAFARHGQVGSVRVIFGGTRPEVRDRAVARALLGLLRIVRGGTVTEA